MTDRELIYLALTACILSVWQQARQDLLRQNYTFWQAWIAGLIATVSFFLIVGMAVHLLWSI